MATAQLARGLGDLLDALPHDEPRDALWELNQRRAERLAAIRNGHGPSTAA
jgi:hypothetical protein